MFPTISGCEPGGDANNWANDSVFVQFTKVTGALIGTTAATEMNLEDCSGCGISGWGWQDNGYGVVGPDFVFSERGTQTIRVQTREDGVAIDQIVLSPTASRKTSPGLVEERQHNRSEIEAQDTDDAEEHGLTRTRQFGWPMPAYGRHQEGRQDHGMRTPALPSGARIP